MGFHLIEQFVDTPAERTAAIRRTPLGAIKGLGAPIWCTILSSKYWDADTKLAYYGYRYFHPDQGRWLSRDPLEEQAFFLSYSLIHPSVAYDLYLEASLLSYQFNDNDPIAKVDVLGLGFIDCVKALFELREAMALGQGRLDDILKFIAEGKCPDMGHLKALLQANARASSALNRVMKHCFNQPDASELIEKGMELLNKIAPLFGKPLKCCPAVPVPIPPVPIPIPI